MTTLTNQTSRFKRILLPGIILQSVLIGGGYATGREIVEYGGKFGASGWISGLAIFFGFSLISILSMEACRQWQVYDYKSLLKKLIGKGWVAYEIVYLMLAILIIAVMAAAAGEILNNTLGFNRWVGVSLIIVLVGFLNYKGDDVITKLETIGTIALFSAYIIFSIAVFSTRGSAIAEVFINCARESAFHRGAVVESGALLPSSPPDSRECDAASGAKRRAAATVRVSGSPKSGYAPHLRRQRIAGIRCTAERDWLRARDQPEGDGPAHPAGPNRDGLDPRMRCLRRGLWRGGERRRGRAGREWAERSHRRGRHGVERR